MLSKQITILLAAGLGGGVLAFAAPQEALAEGSAIIKVGGSYYHYTPSRGRSSQSYRSRRYSSRRGDYPRYRYRHYSYQAPYYYSRYHHGGGGLLRFHHPRLRVYGYGHHGYYR